VIELRVGIHGKLPDQGDFVTRGVNQAEVQLIDHCVGTLAEAGAEAALDHAGPACMALRQRGGWQLSSWLPSRDAVGRRFPLVALSQLPAGADGGDPTVAWALFMPIFERVLAGLGQGLELAQLESQLAGIGGQIEPSRVIDLGHQRLGSITSAELWRQVWAGDWATHSRQALAAFLALMAEGHDLIRIQGVVSSAHVAFWYTAACLLRGDGRAPDLVVLHPTACGGEPRLHLGWGRWDPQLLASCLWDRELAGFASAVPTVTGTAPGAAPVWLADALRQAGPSLADLLYALTHPELA
jgi:type VI secretion system ImpM family protein